MMRTICDLPGDLVEEEIFSRVPLTCLRSVRSTCKKWNALCKSQIFGKAAEATRNRFIGFMIMDHRVCLMKFDLHGIRNDQNLVGPCIKQVSVLDQTAISNVIHCDGLLLCVMEDQSRLLVWNPYLGQTRWIQPRTTFNDSDRYSLGYDNNVNYKILRFFYVHYPSRRKYVLGVEIYDFSCNSWKVLDVSPDWEIESRHRFVSLKGNIYFSAKKTTLRTQEIRKEEDFLVCFDSTTEVFRPPLPLPFHSDSGGVFVTLSCVRQEQLALLYQRWETPETIEFCLTDKIDPTAVSWRKFLITSAAFPLHSFAGSFFIDEDKRVAVVFDLDGSQHRLYQTAHIIGEDGYLKSFNIGDAPDPTAPPGDFKYFAKGYCLPLVCSSYVPSLVQLQINQPEIKGNDPLDRESEELYTVRLESSTQIRGLDEQSLSNASEVESVAESFFDALSKLEHKARELEEQYPSYASEVESVAEEHFQLPCIKPFAYIYTSLITPAYAYFFY